MYYTIYKVTNRVNNKIYIGKHQTEDLDDGYMGSGLVLRNAIKKYGIDKFEKEILYVFDNEEQMNNMEKEIVNEEFLLREDVYNLTFGGMGGFNSCSDYKSMGECGQKELQKKYSENIDFKNDVMYRMGMTKRINFSLGKTTPGFKNKTHTDETKQKIGQANSISQSGSGNSLYGTCWIYNNDLKVSKNIKKEELQKWLDSGWIKGRKIKFDK